MPAVFDGSFDHPESLPETYSSIEAKLDANLCLSSMIIRSLLMILLRCRGGATLVASCARDT